MCNNFVISAVICELNPPHKGHISIIEQCKAKTGGYCIAVMSGNYVQRGQPAIFDKWTRTRAILLGGADLVIELPLPYAMGSAERFAFGGISLLSQLGCVDELWFGSEWGEIQKLQEIAHVLEQKDFSETLRKHQGLQAGLSFAKIRQLALAEHLGENTAALLSEPNNILGVSYCQLLERLKSSIQPRTIRRLGAGYHEAELQEHQAFPSATQLRHLLTESPSCDLSPYLPEACAAVLQTALDAGLAPVLPERLEMAVLAKLRTLSMEALQNLPDISEGLEQRLYHAIRQSRSLEELYSTVKTKRYTLSRIRRLIWSAFLGITKADSLQPVPYCRVLGMRKESAPLLSHLTKNASLPVLTRPGESDSLSSFGQRLLQLEQQSTDLYALACPKIQSCGWEFTQQFVTE